MSDAISVQLDSGGPTARWAAGTARSLLTGRLDLVRRGDSTLIDDLVAGVAAEIFEDVPATPETNRAAERALSLVAALVHLGVQLADGWADADEVAHEELVQSLFQLLEQEGVTF